MSLLGDALGGLSVLDPVGMLGTALSGGAQIGSSLISGAAQNSAQDAANAANIQMTQQTNATNEDIAQQQMAFQANMSNTAYQRATADMTKAGINPMLAYMQGGASTPSGASGFASAPEVEPVTGMAKALGSLGSSATDMVRLQKDLSETSSRIALNEVSKEVKDREKEVTENAARKMRSDADTASVNATVASQTQNDRISAANAESRFRKDKAENMRRWLPLDSSVNRIKQGTGLLRNALPFVGGGSSDSGYDDRTYYGGTLVP